jgi:hypothetical protein
MRQGNGKKEPILTVGLNAAALIAKDLKNVDRLAIVAQAWINLACFKETKNHEQE